MNFFLDIDRRRMRNQIRPVLLVFTAPDQLRVQVTVPALVCNPDGALMLLLQHGLELGGRNIFARSLFVGEWGASLLLLRLWRFLHTAGACARTDSIILLNSGSTFASKSAWIWYASVNSANAQRPYWPLLFTPGTQ